MPAKFKCVISDPQTGRSEALELEGDRARPLLGLRIGRTIDASVIGLSGKLKLTGGVDTSGFPMKKGVHGAVKARLLVKRGGTRRRALIRGEVVAEDTYQLNFVRIKPEAEKKKETERPSKRKKNETSGTEEKE